MPRACALQAGILDGAPEFVDPEYPAQDEKPVTTSASSRSLAHTKARGTRVCRLGSITQGAPTCDSFGGACSFEPLQPMVGACALDALFPTRECEWTSWSDFAVPSYQDVPACLLRACLCLPVRSRCAGLPNRDRRLRLPVRPCAPAPLHQALDVGRAILPGGWYKWVRSAQASFTPSPTSCFVCRC